MHIILHREFRHGVNQHLVGIFWLMFLVIGIVVRVHREEHLALYIEIGEGILVQDLRILSGHHTLLDRVVLLIGFHIQISTTIERGYVKKEMTTLGLLHATNKDATNREFSLNQYIMTQIAMIYAQMVVGITNRTVFKSGGRRPGIYQVGNLICRSQQAVFIGSFCEGVFLVLIICSLTSQNAYTILPTENFVGLNFVQAQHLIDIAFYRHTLFWLIAHLTSRITQFRPVVLTPALYHHQQVQMAAMQSIITLKIMGRVSYKTFQLTGKEQVGHNITVIIGWLVRIGIKDGK